MMSRRLVGGALLVLAAAVAGPSRAEAFVLITRGETIKHVGDVVPAMKPALPPDLGGDAAVGYRYRYFGIFWIDLWTWEGEYCLYKDKRYAKLTPAVAAGFLDKTESELSTPFFYRFPPGLLILGGIAALAVVGTIMDRRSKNKLQLLTEDPKYMRALEVLAEQTRKAEAAQATAQTPGGAGPAVSPADAGYEAAVVYLVNEGVPREEAERNLRLLLASMGQPEPPANAD